MSHPMPVGDALAMLRRGVAIPACPLALDGRRRFDERRQRGLFRYYAAAGAGGVAVAVHTTQFEIRDPRVGLFEPVVRIASEEIGAQSRERGRRILKIAGICGATAQARKEAECAAALGYDAGLLSLGALRDAPEDTLVRHVREIAHVIPLMGFYLQPAAGGRPLPFSFWRRFVEIENVVAIKIAPFNRYQTLDVVRAVALAGRENDIALYTGNDDNILADLLTPYRIVTPGGAKTLRIRGGLLGQFSVWTRTFVGLLEEIHSLVDSSAPIPEHWLSRNAEVTDANAAIFDAAHGFRGCIPGINEVLRRQRMLETNLCLNLEEVLSPGQASEIDRVCRDHPWLPDDQFIEEHRHEWVD